MTRRVKICGKHYNLRFVVFRRPLDGECDHPQSKGKEIRIDKRLEGFELLETVIHEVSHACHWQIKEDFILESSKDLAKILWDLGYRLDK